MLIDNTVLYEGSKMIEINKPGNSFFYFFDWDERSYIINMEFQHFHQFYELCIFLDEQAGHLINGAWRVGAGIHEVTGWAPPLFPGRSRGTGTARR